MTGAGPTVFLIPSFKPTDILNDLVGQLRSASELPIVVVDDGSGPDHAEVFQRLKQIPGIRVLTNAINLGKGAALKHGMNHILVNFPDCVGVVTADADGQHTVTDILRVANELEKNSGKAAFGVRRFEFGRSIAKPVWQCCLALIYRFLIGLGVSDTETGLRGIPRRLMLRCLEIRANRYEFETEQLIVIRTIGMQVQEIPIETIYIESNRNSHFRPLRDSAQIYFVLLRYGAASLVTSLTDLAVFSTIMTWSEQLLLSNAIGRLVALWVQFILLRSFVFRTHGGNRELILYLGLVVVSGVISTAMQLQFSNFILLPVLAKIAAEVLVFVFNFLFLRDFVFGRTNDAASD